MFLNLSSFWISNHFWNDGRVSHTTFHSWLNWSLLVGSTFTQSRATGEALSQVKLIWQILVTVFLRVWFLFSSLQVDWGRQEACTFQQRFKTLDTSWVILAIKAPPLSLWMNTGDPNLGIISFRRALTTSGFFRPARKCFYPTSESVHKY